MVKHATPAPHPGARRRLLAVVALTAALVVPLGYTFALFWGESGGDSRFARDERAGVAYLRPLTKLLGVVADAQSRAVRGQPVAAGTLTDAITAVAAADSRYGDRLRTHTRWAGLRQQLTGLAGAGIGRAAYETYSQAADLTVALMAAVGDTSNLILDPKLDSYYLMDTTLLRLPALLVDSGRLVDLAQLGAAAGLGSAQIFAARDRLATTAAAVDVGLKKSFDATASSTLGPNLLGHVDRLRTVLAELAPTTSLIDLPLATGNAGVLGAARDRAQDATLQLDDAALTELDGLLTTRVARVADRRLGVLVAMLLAAAAGGWVLWSRLPERRPSEQDPTGRAGSGHRFTAGQQPGDEVGEPGRGRHVGVAGGDGSGTAELPDLIDARHLLATGELVRVGRAVQPSRRERWSDDDAD